MCCITLKKRTNTSVPVCRANFTDSGIRWAASQSIGLFVQKKSPNVMSHAPRKADRAIPVHTSELMKSKSRRVSDCSVTPCQSGYFVV